MSLSPFEIWSFADLNSVLDTAIQPPIWSPNAQVEPWRHTSFNLRILTLGLNPDLEGGKVTGSVAMTEFVKIDCAGVSIASVCFKMRKREQRRFSLLPFHDLTFLSATICRTLLQNTIAKQGTAPRCT